MTAKELKAYWPGFHALLSDLVNERLSKALITNEAKITMSVDNEGFITMMISGMRAPRESVSEKSI